MRLSFRRTCLLCVAASCLWLTGCPRSPSPAPVGTGGESSTEAEAAEVLLEPFDPPALEELNGQVTWEDQPVLDAMERFRAFKAEHPPEISVADALKLRNDSSENNQKILSALGQPPASDDEVDYEARLNRHSPLDVKSTNPILGSSVAEFAVSSLTSAGLFTFDWDFIPFASSDFVESWQSSSDRMYDKVVMRDDLVWSDGQPITAHDVAFSFQAIMNPRVPAVAMRSGTSELRWVHAYDDRTVVFFHKEPLATNVWNIMFSIIPRHIYEKSIEEDPSLGATRYHEQQEANPIAGGPYKLVRRVRGQEILLERREDYYMRDGQQVRPKPYFKEVRFRIIEDPNTALLALKNGEIDELQLSAEQWVTQTNDSEFYQRNTKASGVEWSYAYVGWNVKVPFFEDKRVRQAMGYILDHKEMINTIGFGLYEPGQGIFHPTSWMAPDPMPQPYQQNLAKAEDLLDEAGWDDSDGDGYRDKMIDGRLQRFQFTLMLGSGSETALKIAELFKTNLDQVGIICDIKPTEFTVLQENARTHKFQAMMAGWGTGTDPATAKNLWTTRALTESGRNYTQFTHPEVDELFEKGERVFDLEERAKIYGRIHQILWDEQPYTWLYYRSGFFGFNKDLRGYMFSPRDPFGYAPGFYSIWKPKK